MINARSTVSLTRAGPPTRTSRRRNRAARRTRCPPRPTTDGPVWMPRRARTTSVSSMGAALMSEWHVAFRVSPIAPTMAAAAGPKHAQPQLALQRKRGCFWPPTQRFLGRFLKDFARLPKSGTGDFLIVKFTCAWLLIYPSIDTYACTSRNTIHGYNHQTDHARHTLWFSHNRGTNAPHPYPLNRESTDSPQERRARLRQMTVHGRPRDSGSAQV